MRCYKLLFLILAIVVNYEIRAQQCQEPSQCIPCEKTYSIYFINGILNNEEETEAAANKLGELIKEKALDHDVPASCIDVSYSYNPSISKEGADLLNDLMESYAQGLDQNDWSGFFRLILNTANAFDTVQQELAEFFEIETTNVITSTTEAELQIEEFLAKYIHEYTRNYYNGKKMIFVGHSQGNFFANRVFERLTGETNNIIPPIDVPDSIAVVAVATPASYVAIPDTITVPGATPELWTTNYNDVIQYVTDSKHANIPTLKCSSFNYNISAQIKCHSFVESYLEEEPTRTQILDHIFSAISPPKNDPVISDEFQINTYTNGQQRNPSIAIDGHGNFTVVWQSGSGGTVGPDGEEDAGVFAQQFDAQGTPLGPEIHVNSIVVGNQTNPQIAMNPSGEFVVTWVDDREDGDSAGIFAKRFFANGVSKDPIEFQVNTFASYQQSQPAVAVKDNGEFIIVWQSSQIVGSGNFVPGTELYFQQFDISGNPIGAETQVNVFINGTQNQGSVSFLPSDDFAIAWNSTHLNCSAGCSGHDVFANVFSSDGTRLFFNDEFKVNVNQRFYPYGSYPHVAVSPDGSFVIGYGTGETLYIRQYDSLGLTVSQELQIASDIRVATPRVQIFPHQDGGFIAVWADVDADSLGVIFAQQFDSSLNKTGEKFQINDAIKWADDPTIAGTQDTFVVVWESRLPQDINGFGIFGRIYTGY